MGDADLSVILEITPCLADEGTELIELPEGNIVDHKFPQRFLYIPTTSRRTSLRIMDSFQGLTPKFPHHGINLCLQGQIFYDHIDQTLKKTLDYAAEGLSRKLSVEKAWATIKNLAQYEDEGWNDPVIPEEWSLDYENPNIEKLLRVMEYKVDALMKTQSR
ncbi:hypothetical protein Tco_0366165 [Tanacetum coccineum]